MTVAEMLGVLFVASLTIFFGSFGVMSRRRLKEIRQVDMLRRDSMEYAGYEVGAVFGFLFCAFGVILLISVLAPASWWSWRIW